MKGRYKLGELLAINYENKVDLYAISCEGVDWIKLAQDMLQCLAIRCTVTYPLVSYGM